MSKTFELTLSLNVLEHLGINLYSNVPSVLSEIVANAWDADASLVTVDWDRKNKKIVIQDNGLGMTTAEVNERFLTVGYRRRDNQPGTTAKGRHPMGRKGIGKLSLFSIAGVVQVETAKGNSKSALVMRLNDIRKKIKKQGGVGTYNPEELPISSVNFKHGTRITLSDLRHRQSVATSAALRKRVARRFSILGAAHGFKIEIDGKAVVAADRDYYNKVQYIWTYGDQSETLKLCTKIENKEVRPVDPVKDLDVSGWLGTVKESGQLKDTDGENLNKVAIFVRGKMAQEDILTDFSERGVYASYLIGEIKVEGLDLYEGGKTKQDEDAATSSRQKLVEEDPRYLRLKDFLSKELKHIQNQWAELRAEDGAKRAEEIPAVKDWLDGLSPSPRKKARKWLGKLNRINMDNVEEGKQLIKHAVLGFEFYRLHENLDALDDISDENLVTALAVFHELDGLESNLYGQIVQQRIKVIRTLREKVEKNSLERAIQEYLFNHLWLLDPSWERVEGTEVMEKRVETLIKTVTSKLTSEEKKGRLDIAYRKAAGEHIIIELKRPARACGRSELLDQSEKYLTGLKKLLEEQGTPNEPIEIVFVLGKRPKEWSNPDGRERVTEQLKANHARVVFYDGLLANAEKAYSEYMKKRGLVDKLSEVINAIDNYAPEED